MSEIFASPLFGLTLTIIAYIIAVNIQKKTGLVLCNLPNLLGKFPFPLPAPAVGNSVTLVILPLLPPGS